MRYLDKFQAILIQTFDIGPRMIGRRKRGLLAGLMAIMELEDLSLCTHVWNGVPSICLLIRIW